MSHMKNLVTGIPETPIEFVHRLDKVRMLSLCIHSLSTSYTCRDNVRVYTNMMVYKPDFNRIRPVNHRYAHGIDPSQSPYSTLHV